jgi:hypothetical protein
VRRAILLGLFLLVACKEKDPVVATIDQVTEAAEDRDAEEVMKYVASNYADRAEVQDLLRRYFFAYRTIDVSVQQLESNHSTDSGAATFRVDFLGVPKEIGGLDQIMPRTAVYRFDVDFVVENGQWKISAAEWRQER